MPPTAGGGRLGSTRRGPISTLSAWRWMGESASSANRFFVDGVAVVQRMVWLDVTADAFRWQWQRSRDGREFVGAGLGDPLPAGLTVTRSSHSWSRGRASLEAANPATCDIQVGEGAVACRCCPVKQGCSSGCAAPVLPASMGLRQRRSSRCRVMAVSGSLAPPWIRPRRDSTADEDAVASASRGMSRLTAAASPRGASRCCRR